ncbi:MAG: hypothetical protein HeimC3_36030 [Candidatus Heimdallarchaeota archaeon LC_3]|nr:MAG: hypothetical protein HeimC3_36030 [Candidatus Heimdallarchaeota archaeon LC_3]
MESSTLFTVASLFGHKAGTLFTVVDNHESKEILKEDAWNELEEKIISCGLAIIELLNNPIL